MEISFNLTIKSQSIYLYFNMCNNVEKVSIDLKGGQYQ